MPKPRLLRSIALLLAAAAATSCGNGSSGLDIGTETLVGSIVLTDPGDCGGPGHPVPAKPPFSGAVLDASAATLADLQLGCSYSGGPTGGVTIATSLRAEQVPHQGTVFRLVGSAAPGPVGCTLGPSATRHCLGGERAGRECRSNDECGPPESRTACEPDARCYVAPPTQIAAGVVPGADVTTCIVRAIDADLAGSLDVATGALEWTQAATTRIYLGECPKCVAGVCDGGDNARGACEASDGWETSVDCPPRSENFFVSVPVEVRNSTGEITLTADADGRFCAGQTVPGAFGLPTARTIVQQGMPAGDLRDLAPHEIRTVAAACVPLSRSAVANSIGGLPYPLTFSASATLQLRTPAPGE